MSLIERQAKKEREKKETGGWGERLLNAFYDLVSTDYETRMGIYKNI